MIEEKKRKKHAFRIDEVWSVFGTTGTRGRWTMTISWRGGLGLNRIHFTESPMNRVGHSGAFPWDTPVRAGARRCV